jgi:hypothetical protein
MLWKYYIGISFNVRVTLTCLHASFILNVMLVSKVNSNQIACGFVVIVRAEVLDINNPSIFLKLFNQLHSLQRYDAEYNYGILEWFSVCPNLTSNFDHHRHI